MEHIKTEYITDSIDLNAGTASSKAFIDGSGHIDAKKTNLSRVGVFNYTNSDGSIRREARLPEHVFCKKSLKTLNMIPITMGHPDDVIVNNKDLTIGMTGENSDYSDGVHITNNIKITDKDAAADIKAGVKEVSLGYTRNLIQSNGVFNGEEYDCIQTDIKYKHLAVVPHGRAGATARINLDKKENDMSEQKSLLTVPQDIHDRVVSDLDKSKIAMDTAEKSHGEKIALLEKDIADLKLAIESKEVAMDSLEKTLPDMAREIAAVQNAFDSVDYSACNSVADYKKAAVMDSGKDIEDKSDEYIAGVFDSLVLEKANADSDSKIAIDSKKEFGEKFAKKPEVKVIEHPIHSNWKKRLKEIK